MDLKEIFMGGGGALVVLLTLVQIAPVKVNPWSAIAKAVGKAVNADVTKETTGAPPTGTAPAFCISTMNCSALSTTPRRSLTRFWLR